MKIYLVTNQSIERQMKVLDSADNSYYLFSFEYHFQAGKKKINDIFKENTLLDSGAFSFLNSKKEHKVDWDNYIERYAEFINKYKIKLFFELDIDSLVGIKEVERLRQKIETLTQKQCIPVWHLSRGIAYFDKMCKEYKYIAIGGLVTKEITRKNYPQIKKLVDYANQKKVRVHGLGFTNLEWLKKIKWYSVDSTSWAGVQFGYTFFTFIGDKLHQKDIYGMKSGKEHYDRLLENNAREWVKYQKYAEIHL